MNFSSASKLHFQRRQLPFITLLVSDFYPFIVWQRLTKSPQFLQMPSHPIKSQSRFSSDQCGRGFFPVCYLSFRARGPSYCVPAMFSPWDAHTFWSEVIFFSLSLHPLFFCLFLFFPAVVTPLVIWGSHELCHRSRYVDVRRFSGLISISYRASGYSENRFFLCCSLVVNERKWTATLSLFFLMNEWQLVFRMCNGC